MDCTVVCDREGKQPDLDEDSLFSGSGGSISKIDLFLRSECTRDDLSRNTVVIVLHAEHRVDKYVQCLRP